MEKERESRVSMAQPEGDAQLVSQAEVGADWEGKGPTPEGFQRKSRVSSSACLGASAGLPLSRIFPAGLPTAAMHGQ